MLDKLIPPPYRMAALAVLGAVIFSAGGVTALVFAEKHYQPMIDAANTRAGQMQNAYTAIATAAGRQNAAIAELEEQGRVREQKAAAALTAARAEAKQASGRALWILGTRPPPGADECRAARDAFDDELRHERGK